MTTAIRLLSLVVVGALLAACASPGMKAAREQQQKAAEINVQLGINYLQQGDLRTANAKLERALEQDPDLATGHWVYALLQARLERYEAAERHFERALALDPNDSKAHNNYGTFLCERDRVDEAIEQFEAAVENPLYESPATAYTNAGICLVRVGRIDEARAYLRKALEADGRFAQALYQMAKLSYRAGRYSKTRDYLHRYAAQGRHTPQTLWLCVRTERRLGNGAEARRCAETLRERYPQSREARRLSQDEGYGSGIVN